MKKKILNMRNKILVLLLSTVVGLSSCKKFLDINTNPNEATSATPQLILPQAIVATANQVNGYNTTGAQLGGMMANAGGYGGFGSAVTYAFSSADHQGRWGFYDVLNDYQLVMNYSSGDPAMRLFNASARIMRAHGFQLLVDQYNSIPYSDALKGVTTLTPKYDDPAVIYKDLADELDKAIDTINAALAATVSPTPLTEATDPMFKGNMTSWKKFANTLKLKIIVTAGGKVTFSAKNKTFTDGFLSTDALINPGYVRNTGKQNPKWSTWGFSETGTDANKAWMPNTFVMAFYHGEKLLDPGRGAAIYYTYPSTPSNRLGYEGPPAAAASPSGSFWYPSTNRDGKTSGNARGVLKGPDAGMPVITAAESYFLQAEATVRGIITGGNAKALFESGILASYNYLYMLPSGTVSGSPATDFATYLSDNSTSSLVNWTLATTVAQQIEAIITQKYIAMNMVNSDVAWNDYRRTGYPSVVNTAGATAIQTFASTQSKSTRPDHLPTRILYPSSEGAYNSSNVPRGIDPYSSLIFWAQ